MDLSIIIVNYKTPQLVIDCLATVYSQTSQISFEVIVVDNASGDNSRDLISSTIPNVIWVQMDYNAGFARANNEGIGISIGDVVLLLNSDTLIVDSAIEKCYQSFSESSFVACGVQLINPDNTPQISGNYVMRGGLNNLLPLPYVGNFIKWLGTSAGVKKPNVPDSDAIIEVDWINGAFLMVKRLAIQKAGLMDADFFLYAEEAEWCSRLKKAGGLCIFGQFKVIHLQGASANETFQSSGSGYYNLYDRKGMQIMLSNFVRIRKQFGVGWFLFHLLAYTFTIPIFFIFQLLVNVFRLINPLHKMKDVAGFTRNVFKLWSYLPAIVANKKTFYKV